MKTYEATVTDDRIEWIGAAPDARVRDGKVRVNVTFPDVVEEPNGVAPSGPPDSPKFNYVNSLAEAEPWTEEKRQKLLDILARIHESNPFREIDDPVAWQREIRKDRPLPGREP